MEKTVFVTNTAVIARSDAPKVHSAADDENAAATNGAGVFAFLAATSTPPHVASGADAAALLKMKDPASRAQAFARLLAGVTPANARAIMELFLKKGFNSPREEEEIRMLAESWGAVDGKSAADYLDSVPHDQRPQLSLRATLAEWAMHDTDAAEAWAKNETTNQPNPYMIGVIAGAANVDLTRAQTMLYEMPYGRERGDAMAYVAGAHLENGNADAMTWATSVPDPRLEQAAIRKVATQVALADPVDAANWVLKNSNPDSIAYNVSTVAKQWSYQSPEDAVNWALGLPAGAAQDAAVAAALPSLVAKDPSAVEKILLNQPATQATDPARITLAKEYSSTDPVRAIAWANTVTDPRTRDHLTQHVMQSWMQTDPAAAAQFMQPKPQ